MPDHWQSTTLGDWISIQRGHDLPKNSRRHGAVPVVGSTGPVGLHDESRGPVPGVVTGRSGTIGVVQTYVEPYWPLNTTLYVTDFGQSEPQFVAETLRHMNLTRFAGGGAVPSLDRKVLYKEQIALPPLIEQRRIVDLVGSIDNHIDALEKQIDATRTARQGVLSELLSNPGDNWQWTTLGEVARWTSGGTPKAGEASFYGGDIPWCVIGDLTESYVTKTEKTLTAEGLSQSSAKLLPIGAVMIAMYGASIGRTGITDIPMATNQAIASALVDENKINNLFLLQFLQNQKEKFVARGTGGAQPNISQMVIKSWPIDLPSLADQERIVGLIGSFDDQISALETQIDAARATRSGVLSELLSGDRLLDESYDRAVGW